MLLETIISYDKLIQQISSLAHLLKIYPKAFDKEEFHGLHKFFDKALFTVLNQLDLAIGLKYLDLSQAIKNNLEANYFSRIVILTSHEILNDLQKMVGKDIRAELIEKIGTNGIKELDETTKEMNTLRKKYLGKLKSLRNKVLGHKHEHAYQQAEMMVSIDIKEVYTIGEEIFKVQMKFMNNYFKLLENV